MLSFSVYVKRDYFINWHHAVTCHYLDKFIAGEIKRLIIVMPPRHGKSQLVSRHLPAYILGKNPDAQIIACSYSADLARLMNRDTQRIMDTPYYKMAFPGTKLGGDNIRTVTGAPLRNSDIFEIVGRRGQYRACGIGGGITGMGADFAIVDDPIKNMEEANSPVYREKIWEWYTSTLYTRLEKDGAILVTVTPWHADDLVGRLQAHDDDTWTVVRFPAVYDLTCIDEDERTEPGQALWPTKYNEDRLADIRRAVGSRVWAALYQCSPVIEGGNIFKREWWKRYTMLPKLVTRVYQVWDTAFKEKTSSDFSACTTWAETNDGLKMLDWFKDKMTYPDLKQKAIDLAARWARPGCKYVEAILVEDKASGQSLVQDLQRSTELPIVARQVKDDKVTRAHAVTAMLEAGHVALPSEVQWVDEFLTIMEKFPNGPEDDTVDSVTLALAEYNKKLTSSIVAAIGTTISARQEEEVF